MTAKVAEAAKERKAEGGRKAGRGRPQKVPEKIREAKGKRHSRETREVIAKSHGTNAEPTCSRGYSSIQQPSVFPGIIASRR